MHQVRTTEETRLISKFDNEIRKQMTMFPVIQDDGVAANIFDLSKTEKELTPDDWAWQFLRLNPEYQKDYNHASENGFLRKSKERAFKSKTHIDLLKLIKNKKDEKDALEKIDTINLKINSERLCREKYGLSTWLNPNKDRASSLKNTSHTLPIIDGGSWFSPLYTHVNFVSRTGMIFTKEIFGYEGRSSTHSRSMDASKATFIVDCSTPIESQFNYIRILCKLLSEHLEESPYKTAPVNAKFTGVISDYLSSKDIEIIPQARPNKSFESMYWRVFSIDIASTYGSVIDKIETVLRKEYLSLYKETSGFQKRPTSNSFKHYKNIPDEYFIRNYLPSRAPKSGGTSKGTKSLTDGNQYKQMLIAKQMIMSGLSIQEICILLRAKYNYPSTNLWHRNIGDRIEASLKQADKLIVNNYKWLVYTQYQPE